MIIVGPYWDMIPLRSAFDHKKSRKAEALKRNLDREVAAVVSTPSLLYTTGENFRRGRMFEPSRSVIRKI